MVEQLQSWTRWQPPWQCCGLCCGCSQRGQPSWGFIWIPNRFDWVFLKGKKRPKKQNMAYMDIVGLRSTFSSEISVVSKHTVATPGN